MPPAIGCMTQRRDGARQARSALATVSACAGWCCRRGSNCQGCWSSLPAWSCSKACKRVCCTLRRPTPRHGAVHALHTPPTTAPPHTHTRTTTCVGLLLRAAAPCAAAGRCSGAGHGLRATPLPQRARHTHLAPWRNGAAAATAPAKRIRLSFLCHIQTPRALRSCVCRGVYWPRWRW